ncbi:hypothetical protein [Fructilactobacillus fructivorans]|uniref:Uncharacterized protein n=1 Tax=Fructilactobacillus fructivorans TaxID=1614 RepID=A0A0C1Q044_9LACO|nr:hypothetical protein [Fructilactobacillus fructivorans]KID41248.1 hypothetical protein LfDm3_1093 [Fructilactobacillus fructivorans]KRK58766.1 hypothetical protein FC73_GL000321 [Fructilactobacillus fructivorans]KRN13677.1 hypothetical protein IV37_GL000401 [Fructilactobacillus fructivorans]KRN39621.1 hypothetical protein IV51_GL000988 [Fructilactobacillus fructivorans]KRN43341.1 hypothetical protein IV48_GL000574 [Fructilactobacillus fructivorans]
MKRITVTFPAPGKSETKTIKVDHNNQYVMELTTLENLAPDGHSLEIKFLPGTSEDFPERGTTIYLNGFDQTFKLSNGDILVTKSM